jgi:hypothetical protein
MSSCFQFRSCDNEDNTNIFVNLNAFYDFSLVDLNLKLIFLLVRNSTLFRFIIFSEMMNLKRHLVLLLGRGIGTSQYLALNMETVYFSETFVSICESTRRHNPEEQHRSKNLESRYRFL